MDDEDAKLEILNSKRLRRAFQESFVGVTNERFPLLREVVSSCSYLYIDREDYKKYK